MNKFISIFVLALLAITCVNAQLYLNEEMTGNTLMPDEDGSLSDWFEIYNSGASPVNLEGYYVTDNAVLTQWRFPNATVPANGFLFIWASSKDKVNGSSIHTNFSLKAGGETLTLTSPDGTTVIDSIPATAIPTDKTYGRLTDGGTLGFLDAPTPLATNIIPIAPLAISFSRQAGVYNGSFFLNLTINRNATIYYTLDGSIPNASSLVYTGPLSLTNNSGKPNNISLNSNTSPSWTAPAGEITKATVVRAIAIAGNESTAVKTATYLVDTNFTLPIVSISTDIGNLFDYDTGIYTKGKSWDDAINWTGQQTFHPANYRNDGDDWERRVHLEFFEQNGTRVVDQDTGIQISGQGSRERQQKSLRFYARGDYGKSSIAYSFFPGRNLTSYKRVTIRNPDDNNQTTFLRDALAHEIVRGTTLAAEDYRPVVVFLNGEYWGLYPLREKANQHYLAAHYGVDSDEVVILEDNVLLDEGNPGDEQPYLDLLTFARTHDLSNSSNYAYMQTQMDTESFARYYALETYVANTDWPTKNVEFWRLKTPYNASAPYGHDGRWRWVLHDADFAFGYVVGIGPEYNMLEHVNSSVVGGQLWRDLSHNEQFRDTFVTISADQLLTNFASSSVIAKLDAMAAQIAPEVPMQVFRWTTIPDTAKWEQNIQNMRSFIQARPALHRKHIAAYFGLAGTANLTVERTGSGVVNVNSLTPPSSPWVGEKFQDVPISLHAQADAGHVFVGWEGAASGSNPDIKIVLSGNAMVRAVFAPTGSSPSVTGAPVWVTRKFPASLATINRSTPFGVELGNPTGIPVQTQWLLDGVPVQNGTNTYVLNTGAGVHSLQLQIIAGNTTITQKWNVTMLQVIPMQCFANVQSLPSTCTGGSITQDKIAGGCRTVSCGAVSGNLTVTACNKPTDLNPTFFEMYKTASSGQPPKICLGQTCLQSGGYIQSSLPACVPLEGNSSSVNFSLIATSSPVANISLNGTPVGITPKTFSLAAGSWLITLNAPGYQPLSQLVQLNGDTTLSLLLNATGSGQGNGTNSTSNVTNNSTCYSNLPSIPATCVGGNITTDNNGGCRVIVCTNGSSSLQIQACSKGAYFEISRQTQVGSSIKNICIGPTCIGNNGFVKSANFPICIGTASNTTNSTNATNATNQTTNFTLNVFSTPVGTLTINGTGFGTTPKTLSLVPGSYLVSVSAASYTSNATTITLGSNMTLNLTMQQTVVNVSNGTGNGTNGTGNATNSTVNSTGNATNATAALSIAPWFPQGRSYVFICNATGFTPTVYDFKFGDNHQNMGRTTKDVYYTYATAGSYNVSCTARNSTFSRNGTLAVVVV